MIQYSYYTIILSIYVNGIKKQTNLGRGGWASKKPLDSPPLGHIFDQKELT